MVELNLSLTEIFSTVNPNTLAIYRVAIQSTLLTAKVLATEVEISGQDTAAELAALKATAKAQDAKIKALSAQLRGDTSGAKRARSGAPVDKKPIPVCTVCGKRGLLGQARRRPSQARCGQGES